MLRTETAHAKSYIELITCLGNDGEVQHATFEAEGMDHLKRHVCSQNSMALDSVRCPVPQIPFAGVWAFPFLRVLLSGVGCNIKWKPKQLRFQVPYDMEHPNQAQANSAILNPQTQTPSPVHGSLSRSRRKRIEGHRPRAVAGALSTCRAASHGPAQSRGDGSVCVLGMGNLREPGLGWFKR